MKLDVIVVDWEATIGQPILAVDLIESYVWTNGKNLKKTYHHERIIEREDGEPIEIIQESFIEIDKSIKFKV